MIKGDCFTPKYEDFELEEEIKPEENNENEGESGTYEKNKVNESTTDLWEFRTTMKGTLLAWFTTNNNKTNLNPNYALFYKTDMQEDLVGEPFWSLVWFWLYKISCWVASGRPAFKLWPIKNPLLFPGVSIAT